MTQPTVGQMLADPGFRAFLLDPEMQKKSAEALVAGPLMNAEWVNGHLHGRHQIARLMKRKYKIVGGVCEPVEDAGHGVLMRGHVHYFERDEESLRPPPPGYVSDYYAAREKTDVVIQGLAFAPKGKTKRLELRARFDAHERVVVAIGPRVGEQSPTGQLRWTEPVPFEALPVRYDFAYGGIDRWAAVRHYARFAKRRGYTGPLRIPDESVFQYPRNPCGRGYLIQLTRTAFVGMVAPYLEHAFDPLTPERLAVGSTAGWMKGPLPACWDWQAETWFPRCAYLGLAPEHDGEVRRPREVELGWEADDLTDIDCIVERYDEEVRPEFAQCASSGMAVDLPVDASFEIQHMHPDRPRLRFDLPGERPVVHVDLGGPSLTELSPHLCSVLVRPHREEIVTVWAARTAVDSEHQADELAKRRTTTVWKKDKR